MRTAGHKIGPGFIPAMFRLSLLCKKRKWDQATAFRLGLFRPDVSHNEIEGYTSRKNVTRIQKILNPEGLDVLVRNKGLFYRYCMALGIPIPKLYAIFGSGSGDRTFDRSRPDTKTTLCEFIDSKLPDEFISKPLCGDHGYGLKVFHKDGSELRNHLDQVVDMDKLCEELLTNDQAVVIQERLYNHQAIRNFTGTPYLQTVRIISLLDDRGDCEILHAHFRHIAGNNIVDASHKGRLNNSQATVNVKTGELHSFLRGTRTGRGPDTIVPPSDPSEFLDRRELPYWTQTCELIAQAAPHFWPLRTLGWDIAITPDGPVVVEANAFWNAPNRHSTSLTLMKRMADAAGVEL